MLARSFVSEGAAPRQSAALSAAEEVLEQA